MSGVPVTPCADDPHVRVGAAPAPGCPTTRRRTDAPDGTPHARFSRRGRACGPRGARRRRRPGVGADHLRSRGRTGGDHRDLAPRSVMHLDARSRDPGLQRDARLPGRPHRGPGPSLRRLHPRAHRHAAHQHHRAQLPRRGLPQQLPHRARGVPRSRRGRRVRERLLEHHDRRQHEPELARRRHLRQRLRRGRDAAQPPRRGRQQHRHLPRGRLEELRRREQHHRQQRLRREQPRGGRVHVRGRRLLVLGHWTRGPGDRRVAVQHRPQQHVPEQHRRRHLPLQELRRVRDRSARSAGSTVATAPTAT